jgi:hypothetical protein
MQRHHAQIGLRWALAFAGVGLALVALLWTAAPLAGPEQLAAPTSVETGGVEPVSASLPAPSPETSAAPAPDPAPRPVERLVPKGPDPPRPASNVAGAPTAYAALTLTLVQPNGKPAAGGIVTLSAPRTTWTQAAGSRQRPISDDAGQLPFPKVPAETQLELSVTDALGFDVLRPVQLTLAAGEHRRLTQRLDRELRTVVVQVVDRAGGGLSAEVTLNAVRNEARGDPRSAYRSTDEEGRAAFVGIAADTVSVWATRAGYAPMWRSALPLDRDPLQIVLTLESGPSVDVEIVDGSGRPRDVDSVELRGVPMSVLAERVATGLYRFPAFPRAATGVIASVQGRTWMTPHTASEPVAHLVVPASGALSVTWGRLPEGCEPNGIFISSEPPGWSWFEHLDAGTLAGRGPVRFETLAPGDYNVRLNCPNPPAGPPDFDLETRATVQSGKTADVRIVP